MSAWQISSHNEHLWEVPDLAVFEGQSKNVFTGRCYCGATTHRSGAEWKALAVKANFKPVLPAIEAPGEGEGGEK